MKVLITGGAGFIAHHIIAHVIKNTDWDIVTLDRLDLSGNLNRLHEILGEFSAKDKKRLKIVLHDLKAEIYSQIKNEIGAPDIILHLAAASHVDRSIIYPMEFVLYNVVGTVNLLDFARSLKNFGFSKLNLVTPKFTFPNQKTKVTSVGAFDLINSAKVFDNIEKAIS